MCLYLKECFMPLLADSGVIFDISGSALLWCRVFNHQISGLWCAFNIITRVRGDRLILHHVRCIKKVFAFSGLSCCYEPCFRPLYLYMPKFYCFIICSFYPLGHGSCLILHACDKGLFMRTLMIWCVSSAAYISGVFMHYTMPLSCLCEMSCITVCCSACDNELHFILRMWSFIAHRYSCRTFVSDCLRLLKFYAVIKIWQFLICWAPPLFSWGWHFHFLCTVSFMYTLTCS
jgi:hypothetical protein